MTPVIFAITVSSLILSAMATWFVLNYARRRLVDHPNERSSHLIPTPRGGGLGMVIGLVGVIGSMSLLGRVGWMSVALLLPIVAMAALGWWDDHASLPAGRRLIVHVALMATAVGMIGVPAELRVMSWSVPMRPELAWLLVVVGGAWMVNLTNFMDGIDGIAGVQGAVACAAFTALLIPMAYGPEVAVSPLLMATGGACGGFLIWNWAPARIFMGDVGSTALGLVLAIGFLAVVRSGLAVDLAVLPITPFVADATCTLLRRAWRRERLSSPHRSHLYQRLAKHWNSHRSVSLLYAGLAILGSILAELSRRDWMPSGVAFGSWVSIYALLAVWGRRVAPP